MADDLQVSAVARRFSPDMKARWLPTIDGKIIVGETIPFSGFNTRSEAIEAGRALSRPHLSTPEKLP